MGTFGVRIFWGLLSPKYRQNTYPRHRRIAKKILRGYTHRRWDIPVPALAIEVPTYSTCTYIACRVLCKMSVGGWETKRVPFCVNHFGVFDWARSGENGVGVGTEFRCLWQRLSQFVNAGVNFVFRRLNQLSFCPCRDPRKSCKGMQCLGNMSCQFWFPDNG